MTRNFNLMNNVWHLLSNSLLISTNDPAYTPVGLAGSERPLGSNQKATQIHQPAGKLLSYCRKIQSISFKTHHLDNYH